MTVLGAKHDRSIASFIVASSPIFSRSRSAYRTARSESLDFLASVSTDGHALPSSSAKSAIASRTSNVPLEARLFAHTQVMVRRLTAPASG
jgi:hypothetical protein